MIESSDVNRKIDDSAALIERARRALSQGKPVDLANIEGRIGILCEAIAGLPAREAQDAKTGLVALMDSLNSLSQELESEHARLQQSLSGLDDRRRATAAYGKPPAAEG
jgi:phage shock protein A